MIKFIRDTREKKGKGWSWRKSKNFAGTEIKKLDYGDYSIDGYESRIVVERKGAAGELVTNVMTADSKRFKRELAKLSKLPFAYIICEFSLHDVRRHLSILNRRGYRRMTYNGFVGAIASLMAQYRVPFLFCGGNLISGRKKIMFGKDLAKRLLIKAHKYIDGKKNN